MMINLKEIRNKFPQYNDMDDHQLTEAVHKKYYSDMPFQEFRDKSGLKTMGWKGIAEDVSKLPGAIGSAIYPGIPSGIRSVAKNPERLPGNILQGIAEIGRAPTAALPAAADYLASKGIISEETAGKMPLRPPNIENAFNPPPTAEQMPGDMLSQLLTGGLNIPGAPKAVAKFGAATSKAGGEVAGRIKAAPQKAIESISEGFPGKVYRGISNERTGEVLKEGYKRDLEKSRNLYSQTFKTAEEKGVQKIPHDINEKDIDIIKDYLPNKFTDGLMKAMETGSFEDFHKAQSDLLRYSRDIEREALINKSLPISVKDAGKKAKELSEKIQNSISKELLEKGGMDLFFDYIEAGQNYAKNVAPWFDLESIKGTQKMPGSPGYRFPSNLPPEALAKKANAFLSGKGKEFPELMINQMAKSPLAQLVETLAGLGVFGKVAKE